MASVVQICNMALAHIKASPIDSLSESSTEALYCSTFYEQARDETLRDHPWNFATKYISLTLDEEEPNTDWLYAYQYPNDCVAARRLLSTTRDGEKVEFKVSVTDDLTAKRILTDKEDAVLEYTARVTNTALYDLLCVQAIARKLATYLAMPVTGSAELAQRAEQAYQQMLLTARTADSNEGQPDELVDADWIEARA